MVFKRLRISKNGIGTSFGAVFFIGLLAASLILMMVIDSYQTHYIDVREEITEWDMKRTDENLDIIDIIQPSSSLNYTYDVVVNNGDIYLSVVRIYVYDNENQTLHIYDEQETSGEEGFNRMSGKIFQAKKGHPIKVNASMNLETTIYNRYRIIVCTERGRQFSYSYPPSPGPWEDEGSGMGNYPIIIASTNHSFEYTCEGVTEWAQGNLKAALTERTLYRILVNNTTDKRVYLHENCTMLQMVGKVGQANPRYIVSNQSTSTPDNIIAFSNQSIPPKAEQYLYFTASTPGGTDYRAEFSQAYYLIGFLFRFSYEGESELRYISLPVVPQELTN